MSGDSPVLGPNVARDSNTRRWILAVVTGLLVCVISLLVGWLGARSVYYGRMDQLDVEGDMFLISKRIDEYRTETGHLPETLDVANVEWLDASLDDKDFRDPWGNRLIYEVNSDTYILKSLGRDGKPGGVGYDFDLTPQAMFNDPRSYPTLTQYYGNPRTQGMLSCGLLSGVLAGALCWRVTRSQYFQGSLTHEQFGLIGCTLLGSLVIGAIMVFLHQPQGH